MFSFALQNNLTFYLHGSLVEPPLENLDDALELREQALPSDDVWQQARARAAEILGIVPAPLLTATNVAKFAANVRATAEQYQQSVELLYTTLSQRLEALRIDTRSTPRLQTAQAARAFIRGIAGANKDDVVSVIASVNIATSATAMGESLKKAEEMSAVLENASWELFETVGQIPRERAPQAQSIVERVNDALTRDEHVVELKRTLKDAQSAALELLTSLVEATPPQPPLVQPPIVQPTRSTNEATGSESGIDERSAV